jgi:Neuraminidase-like domain
LPTTNKLDIDAAHDTGEATAAELMAEPQNSIPAAYDTVKGARYPLTLPFDLWLETVRRFCAYFETPLWQVLEVFRLTEELFDLPPKPAIENPTNTTNATVEVPDTDADKFKAGYVVTYYDVSAHVLSAETKTISFIGEAGSGGIGKTLITLSGIWTTPPVAKDLLVIVSYYNRANIFAEYLGISHAEYDVFTSAFLQTPPNTSWYELYGYTTAEPAIENPTNTANATVDILDTDAVKFKVGDVCTYFDSSANALHAETKEISAIRSASSGDAGRTTVTFAGVWTTAPVAGNLLVFDALAVLKSAKTLSQRLGVSYQELTELMKTAFVNPNLNSLVMLHKLGVDVSDVFRYMKFVHEESLTAEEKEEKAEFEKRLTHLTQQFTSRDPTFDAKQRLTDLWDHHHFEKVLLLRDPDTGCSFDETTVLHADGTDASALDFVKMNVFVRLWRRLGWTMEETDRALQTFLPSHVAIDGTTLGSAMKTALVYLAHLKELTELLSVGKDSRMKLLTLWADLPTKGKNSLYAQLFLTRTILKDDITFDDPLGEYLSNPNEPLVKHLPALQSALNLTADEITQILQDGNTGDEHDIKKATLSLPNVSLLYRYGLLARAVKVSVSELITLKALSGLNPFHSLSQDALDKLEHDYALTHTLAFVRAAQQVKASAFTISDLDYLFRHRFDPFGTYRENTDTRLAWTRILAAQLHTIASDYAVPANVDSVSDDAMRQKMSLAFAPDVVEMFMAFMLNTVVYSAVKQKVSPQQHFDPAIYGVNGVSVSYDETSQSQQVTHVGVLTEAAKTDLLKNIPPPANKDATDARRNFSELLDDIESESNTQFKAFFAKNFDGLLVKSEDFFGAGVDTTQAQKRAYLLQMILPSLQAKLTHQVIIQAMTTQTGGDAALIETLLTNSTFLALPDANTQSLMTRFEALGQRGLTRELFDTVDPSDSPESKEYVADIEVKPSEHATSARWRGFIEVPQNGAYRFYAILGTKDATVNLRFDIAAEPILSGKAAKDNDDSVGLSGFIELKSGALYPFTLEASNLQGGTLTLLAKGETTPKGPLSQFVLLPQAEMDGAVQTYTMLAKALQLAQGLGLSERDIRHILAHSADFGDVNWQQLPIQVTNDTDADAAKKAVALFNAFVGLMDYAALKRDLAGGGDDLIAIFERARLENPDSLSELCQQIATLTRRKPDVVQATATQVRMTAPEHFAGEARIERLWQALQIVEKFGVSVASLQKWLTPQPDAAVAMDVRNTVKSRYEPETWQGIAKAIFDPLRQRQRDALVAYIMHLQDLDSVEKLFEYFLIDPATEPVVQTSRLRLAISSLQTFIQRCFLNLEKQVHPSVLNAQHWSWMKRYRVWEANRKIFLFPENWLEPEWRDDKTYLYQELESSLLQGDVTNQLAEDALYVYLKKLDQLARLEIVTMYAEEKPPDPPILHVIGRTYASPRQYFYRRYASQMWTPWEPVSAEIDGDHIVAVMWRERLHLFWLTFMEKVEEAATGSPHRNLAVQSKYDRLSATSRTENSTPKVADMQLDDLATAASRAAKGAVKRTLDSQLNWSEYFQGTWTTRESSGFGNTIDLAPPFDPSKVFVTVSKEADPETGTDGAVWIVLNGLSRSFRVVSKNSRPQLQPPSGMSAPTSPYSPKNKFYNRYTGSGALSVTFVQQIVTTDGNQQADPPAPQPIVANVGGYTLLPTSNQMLFPNAEFAPLISPVFYADDVYTFFVEPSLTETTVDKVQGYTITRPSQKPRWDEYVAHRPQLSPVIPPKYLQEAFKQPNGIPQPDPIDPLARHAIKPNLDALTQPDVAVQFGDAIVGRTGRMQDPSTVTQIITSVAGNGTQKL